MRRRWEEHRHPRDDRGRFARVAGRRWAERVLTQMSAGRSMAAGPVRSGGPSGRIDLAAELASSRAFHPARRPADPLADLQADPRISTMLDDPEFSWPSTGQADRMLNAIAENRGFAGQPKLLDQQSLTRRIKQQRLPELARSMSDAQHARNFVGGEYYGGVGYHGNGIYAFYRPAGYDLDRAVRADLFGPDRADLGDAELQRALGEDDEEFQDTLRYLAKAKRRAENKLAGNTSVYGGHTLRMALRPGTKIEKLHEVRRQQEHYLEGLDRRIAEAKGDQRRRLRKWRAAMADPGRFAAATGIEAYEVAPPTGTGPGEIVVLNRGALLVGDNRSKIDVARDSYRPARGDILQEVTHDAPDIYEQAHKRRTVTFNGDIQLNILTERQGFGKPTVGSAQDVEAAGQQGWQIAYRGVTSSEAKQVMQSLRYDDDYKLGTGMYGNGIYTTVSADTAKVFAGRSARITARPSDSVMVRMAINPDARVIDYEQLIDHLAQVSKDVRERLDDAYARGREGHEDIEIFDRAGYLLGDPGRLAAALGYDAIRVPNQHDGGPNQYPPYPDQYVILNRSILLIEEEDLP